MLNMTVGSLVYICVRYITLALFTEIGYLPVLERSKRYFLFMHVDKISERGGLIYFQDPFSVLQQYLLHRIFSDCSRINRNMDSYTEFCKILTSPSYAYVSILAVVSLYHIP